MESSPDDQNGTGWSDQLTVETASKRQQLVTTSARTLTLPPPLRSSSSNPPGDDSVLPFELITEILWRLPVKFLMTLKCVSKPWNSLISSDRKFARKHLLMARMNPKLILKLIPILSPDFSHIVFPLRSFFTDGNGTIINYPLNSEGSSVHIDTECSCDGIVLCLTHTKYLAENFIQIVLWNPSTRKYNLLPVLDKPPHLKDSIKGYVVTQYGFGYDHFSDNYKVVAVFMYYYQVNGDGCCTVRKTQVMVHTLGTDSWRFIQDFPSLIFGSDYLQSGKFVSGTLNWLVLPSDSNTLLPIISLDLGTESYQEILHPDYGAEMITFTLGVLRDCLCILAKSEIQMVSDIWLMKEYGKRESWTKLVSVPYMEFTDYYPCINQALYISEDDQVLLEFMNALQLELVVYDPINSSLKIQDIENFNNLRLPEIYIDSLISPCS